MRPIVDVDSPAARALRAMQRLDEVTPLVDERAFLLEAEDELGKLLGLRCTGTREDGEVLAYDHAGATCPIHEWLVEDDSTDARVAAQRERRLAVGKRP